MQTSLSRFALLAAVLAPLTASAQPAPAPAPPATGDQTSPAVGVSDEKIREIVDREVARILNDRAQKDAADRAAREQAIQDAQAGGNPSDRYPQLTGSSGFMDTRIAFTLTNENVLVKPGETVPSIPGWRFGVPNSFGVLFFDNYDTRYSGFETLSHAVMYRDYKRGHFEGEAAFVVRIPDISDDGTYIKLTNWKDPTHHDPTRVSLTAFPVSADRMRLGYSYRLSWGGNPEYTRTKRVTPGIKIQYDLPKAYAFVGAKSAVVLDRRTAEEKSAWGLLAGAGVDPTPMLRLEVNGGYFDRGYNELEDVNDQKVQLFGASVQAAIHKGMPVQSSIDYKLYRNDNEKISGLFAPVKYPGGLSWLAMTEFTVLGQTLKDYDKIGSTKIQYGMAGDINVRVMMDRVRLRFDASYRDLAFVLHSVPSLPTYSDFPMQFKTSPDVFAAVGIDKNWNDFLTLGVVAGVEKPATLTSPAGAPQIPGSPAPNTTDQTAVFRNNNIDTIITILPAGKSAVPQFALKGSAKLDFGLIYTALIEVFYSRDPNNSGFTREGPEDPFKFSFKQFNQLGVNLTLQARF